MPEQPTQIVAEGLGEAAETLTREAGFRARADCTIANIVREIGPIAEGVTDLAVQELVQRALRHAERYFGRSWKEIAKSE